MATVKANIEPGWEPDQPDIAARYVADSNYWTDMPEASPRARVMVEEGQPQVVVWVLADGKLMHAGDIVIDTDYYY
jgi:hypothetical protein